MRVEQTFKTRTELGEPVEIILTPCSDGEGHFVSLEMMHFPEEADEPDVTIAKAYHPLAARRPWNWLEQQAVDFLEAFATKAERKQVMVNIHAFALANLPT